MVFGGNVSRWKVRGRSRFLKEILASKDGHAVVVQRLRNRDLCLDSAAEGAHRIHGGSAHGGAPSSLHGDAQFRRFEEAEKAGRRQ